MLVKPNHSPVRTEYAVIWTAPGLLGALPRYHSSINYRSARAALAGCGCPPDAGFTLAGVLDLRPGRDQPRFISQIALSARAESEMVAEGPSA